MGVLLKAICNECGFSAETFYGGNMMNFQHNCPVPAIELSTGEFKTVNHKDTSLHNLYDFYTDDVLKHSEYIGATYDNFKLKINAHSNFCPRCHEFSLKFIQTAIFD